MNANNIPLPSGLPWAQKIDDMRELCQFDIVKDCYIWRWDSELPVCGQQARFAEQRSVDTKLPFGDCPDMAFAEENRKVAKKHFLLIEQGLTPK